MATTVTVASGPLEARVAAANDEKAQEVIRRFAWETGAPADASNQQLLNHAAEQLRAFMVRLAKRHKLAEAEQMAVQDAETSVEF